MSAATYSDDVDMFSAAELLVQVRDKQEARRVEAAELARNAAFEALDRSDYKDETKDILRAIITTAHEQSEFSANDVRPHLPADVYTPRIGRAFALAQRMGVVEFVRLTTSTDPGTHAKRINVYRRT